MRSSLLALVLIVLSACQGTKAADDRLDIQVVAQGLERPWALAFLPDGQMLVTEKAGRMRLVDAEGRISQPLAGVPKVDPDGQGGLLDVVLDPRFASTQRIYFSYSEPRQAGNGTTIAHARLTPKGLTDLKVIFRQQPSLQGGLHFGSRLVFATDGTLFATLGERFKARDGAQALDSHLGKVIRIDRDGGVPNDNPFRTQDRALPEIWSYGHRNAQGAALHPETGVLWLHEHGPRGGDELNLIRPGRNYGWPVITYGREYSGATIGGGETAREGMEQPLRHWVPSIAPSGMTFYTAARFPDWQGQLFLGTLKSQQLLRLVLRGERVVQEARYDLDARVRDVRQGPDGYLYVLTDETEGRILRIGRRSPD